MPTFQGKRVSAQWATVLNAAAAAGVRFRLNSGQRTFAEQQSLYDQNMSGGRPKPGHPLTAKPSHTAPHIRTGRQDHAIDVNALDGGETRLQRWLEGQGLKVTNPVPGEAWHMEVPSAQLARFAARLNDRSRALADLRARYDRVRAAILKREKRGVASPGQRKLLAKLRAMIARRR
jgi:hypothetical protein